MEDHEGQLARMKQYAPARRAYLEEWLGCWSDGGDDGDGDGFDMCHDCDDDDAAQSPGAVEVCDNIDNDCDGRVDDGVTVSCAQDPEAAAREAFWNRVYTDVKAQAKARR
ncbi:MAG: putative metal-binding motif-containing protein [Deltaproteobacteria bacterium]|nr:putative metal-binding motif-containing protein [Kofleriaceae bacterium]